ncbi:hypothetical protein [uncultured Parabacteroides sp.]|uniref:hypothetical protein n=1 Tax=uncultured Parabacteroides sp. TaxID=512312 RepID=UPI0028044EC6|nr:hypothetical protein [uncultured Parabacteroides sp.]
MKKLNSRRIVCSKQKVDMSLNIQKAMYRFFATKTVFMAMTTVLIAVTTVFVVHGLGISRQRRPSSR